MALTRLLRHFFSQRNSVFVNQIVI